MIANRIDSKRAFIGRIGRLLKAEQVTLIAAGVAFYAFLSLIPLALLGVGIATAIGGDALAVRVSAAVSDVLTPSAQQLLTDTLVDDTGRTGATIVGALGLIWGSSRVLRGLDLAFSEIYGTAGEKSIIDSLWDALIVALAITAGLAIIAGFELALVFVPFVGITVFGPILVLAGLIVAFLPMYVIFPGVDITVREAIPGTVLAASGWFALSRTFSVYARFAGDYAVYGVLGVVLLVLVWLYAASLLVVFGAVVNVVLAGRDTDRHIQSPGRQISTGAMSTDAPGTDEEPADGRVHERTHDRSRDPEALREEIEQLRDKIDAFEEQVESRTVEKPALEAELKRYVRARIRHGHARGWGPYLVLLYGTVLAIAAFYFLSGGWAILAMIVVWTSTLGMYVLMLLLGAGLSLLDAPGRLRDRLSEWRS